MDVGAFVHLYAQEFVHTDVRLALEYYFAAARVQVCMGGGARCTAWAAF